jgi:hypothetical protein
MKIPLRVAMVATLLSGCAKTAATTTADPSPPREIVFEESDEFDPWNDSLGPKFECTLSEQLGSSWYLDLLLPPDPIPMSPEQAPPVGAPPGAGNIEDQR